MSRLLLLLAARRALPAAAGAACAALCAVPVASAAAATAPPPPPLPPPPPAWAEPSPYDASVPVERFADTYHLRTQRAQWDLPRLVAQWKASESEETWPWVWCAHNPTGPNHVFVGFGAGTLEQIRAVSAASTANNITVVLRGGSGGGGGGTDDDELARCGVSEAELHALRCAVVRERVEQVDAESKLLMLRDERVIAYDTAYLA